MLAYMLSSTYLARVHKWYFLLLGEKENDEATFPVSIFSWFSVAEENADWLFSTQIVCPELAHSISECWCIAAFYKCHKNKWKKREKK